MIPEPAGAVSEGAEGRARRWWSGMEVERGRGTCLVEVGSPPEEARQRGLQHHHKVLQLLRHPHQQVLVHQVVLGLLQGPGAAHVPERSQGGASGCILLVLQLVWSAGLWSGVLPSCLDHYEEIGHVVVVLNVLATVRTG